VAAAVTAVVSVSQEPISSIASNEPIISNATTGTDNIEITDESTSMYNKSGESEKQTANEEVKKTEEAVKQANLAVEPETILSSAESKPETTQSSAESKPETTPSTAESKREVEEAQREAKEANERVIQLEEANKVLQAKLNEKSKYESSSKSVIDSLITSGNKPLTNPYRGDVIDVKNNETQAKIGKFVYEGVGEQKGVVYDNFDKKFDKPQTFAKDDEDSLAKSKPAPVPVPVTVPGPAPTTVPVTVPSPVPSVVKKEKEMYL